MEIGGAAYRRFDNRNWSVERRITDMDQSGVARQVLSPLPELLSYWFAAPAAAEMARHVNGAIAQMMARVPDRFAGLAMVPLQDPDLAAAMVLGLRSDGFSGVEIGSNIDGTSPGGRAIRRLLYGPAANRIGFVRSWRAAGRGGTVDRTHGAAGDHRRADGYRGVRSFNDYDRHSGTASWVAHRLQPWRRGDRIATGALRSRAYGHAGSGGRLPCPAAGRLAILLRFANLRCGVHTISAQQAGLGTVFRRHGLSGGGHGADAAGGVP